MSVHPAVRGIARLWPLTVTQDVGERVAPDGTKKIGVQLHIRCAYKDCGQSVFCAGNDSGAYTWAIGTELEPGLIAHLFQCHRADIDPTGEALTGDEPKAA
jgi:hypothetical protein